MADHGLDWISGYESTDLQVTGHGHLQHDLQHSGCRKPQDPKRIPTPADVVVCETHCMEEILGILNSPLQQRKEEIKQNQLTSTV
jgi:hypothetical protein